jgi:NADH-quinone oxidoreductase subunit F
MITNDLVVIIGGNLSFDAPWLLSKIKNSKIVLISVFEDLNLMDKVSLFSRYEAGSEEGVIALIAKEILKEKKLSSDIEDYFDDLDDGYLSAETNIGEEELEELHVAINKAKNPLLIFGKDLLSHKRVSNITKFIELIEGYTDLDTMSLIDFQKSSTKLEEIEEIDSFDGTIVFEYKSEKNHDLLFGSAQFAIAAKLQDKDNIVLGNSRRKFVLDKKLKGTIALMPSLNESGEYRFKAVKITKREVE